MVLMLDMVTLEQVSGLLKDNLNVGLFLNKFQICSCCCRSKQMHLKQSKLPISLMCEPISELPCHTCTLMLSGQSHYSWKY